jgi:hypothetical protein
MTNLDIIISKYIILRSFFQKIKLYEYHKAFLFVAIVGKFMKKETLMLVELKKPLITRMKIHFEKNDLEKNNYNNISQF